MTLKMTLKQIVFKLLDEDNLTDQAVVDLYGKLPSFQTVQNYKYKWLRKK